MKRLRSILFWSHLAAGSTAGLVILVMCVTGATLAFKPQIVAGIDRAFRYVPAQNEPRLPMSQLVASVKESRPDVAPLTVTVDRNPARSVAVGLERGGTVYVNPYTGAVLGNGSSRALTVFQSIQDWHRWLGASPENRGWARAVTGACNLAFVLLALSGLFLWWPRKWTVQHARPILTFRRAATPRARHFNWHHVIGFWCAPIIIVMAGTGTVLSYPWANDLLYRAVGSAPPSRGPAPAPVAAAGAAQRGATEIGDLAAAIDMTWALAEARLPTWSTVTLRLPNRPRAPLVATLSDSRSWNAFARSTMTVSSSGELVRWQQYEETSLGQKARGWFRFAHTGELAGLPGQVLTGIACLGGVVLVYTGLSLACRRLLSRLAAATGRRRSVRTNRPPTASPSDREPAAV